MSDEQPQDAEEQERKLLSDRYEEFLEALEILYIPGNIGARINFAQNWPEAAPRIFGEELLKFDTEGTTDIERRATLEQEASARRVEFAELVKTLEEKSVDKGALHIEYVEGLIKNLGRDLSLLLYAPAFVERFLPAPPPETSKPESEVSVPDQPTQPEVPPSENQPTASDHIVSESAPKIDSTLTKTPQSATPPSPTTQSAAPENLPHQDLSPQEPQTAQPVPNQSPVIETLPPIEDVHPISAEPAPEAKPTPAPETEPEAKPHAQQAAPKPQKELSAEMLPPETPQPQRPPQAPVQQAQQREALTPQHTPERLPPEPAPTQTKQQSEQPYKTIIRNAPPAQDKQETRPIPPDQSKKE